MSYLDLLLNLPLQLLNLLNEGLFASSQLRDEGLFLLNLAAELTLCENGHQRLVCVHFRGHTLKLSAVKYCLVHTIFCEETSFLSTQVIDLTNILIILGLNFAKLVLKSTAQLFKITLMWRTEMESVRFYLN